MLSIFRLAVRNVWRSKSRTILVVCILGVVLGLGLVMQGVNANISSNVEQIRQSLGNIIMVQPPGSGSGMPAFSTGAALDAAIIDELKDIQHVEEVVGRVIGRPESTSLESPSFGGGGGLFSGFGGRPAAGLDGPLIVLNGIATDQPLSSPQGGEADIIIGHGLTSENEAQNVALVGDDLANQNGQAVGSTFELNDEQFSVVGIFSSGTMFDSLGVYLHLASAQRILGIEGKVSTIMVEVDSFENVEVTIEIMREQVGDRADVVSPLTMITRFIGSTLEGISSTIQTGASVTLVVAGIVLLFTMILVIRESTREIGTLKAIGASNTQVLLQFTTQALALTLVGILAGIGVYLFGSQALPVLLPTGPISRLFGGVEVSLAVGLGYLPWAVLAGIAGGLFPSLYASRINPAEVLRHG
ncbi:MAG: FtsX-like permease family protein [Dehalococcoidales bacterium]|nr:MAG: FtsX-like permease family protein [Dehalococcoidales bacterium]